ncbi:hypothetical protein CSO01_05440 [Cellulomonas soli]|uniref:GGDEF domain-containing protein n=1 Tax=Cellulomonas soli TaxID=931535 RepID=A0A512P9E5_9CELL|nr:hypothetical protein CSO01_05440 [Cellulomonas soli]
MAAPAFGRGLLVATAFAMLAGSAFLSLDSHSWAVVGTLSAVLLGACAASLRVPWQRHPAASIAFPLTVLAALGVVGLMAQDVSVAFASLIPVCFVFTGLFHRARATLALVPFAVAAYLSLMTVFRATTWVRVAIAVFTWLVIGQVLSLTVAHLRRLTRRLEVDARTDPLTRLANRRALSEQLEALEPGDAVAILDLDHFKQINDACGHTAGDAVLKEFARTLELAVRRRDFVARYGGEEFVIVCPQSSALQVLDVLAVVREDWTGRHGGVTFSAGVSRVTTDLPPAAALAAADVALYQAKQAGRDGVRVHDVATPASRWRN